MKKSLFALAAMCAAAAMAVVESTKDFSRTAVRVVSNAVNRAIVEYQMMNGMPQAGLITSTTNNAQNAMRGPFAYSHLDDAAVPAAISLSPGFRPRYVCIDNVTDRIKYEWYDGMAATDYVKTVAAGTRTIATDSKLAVVVAGGSQPSITLAASEVLQNKQYRSIAY